MISAGIASHPVTLLGKALVGEEETQGEPTASEGVVSARLEYFRAFGEGVPGAATLSEIKTAISTRQPLESDVQDA